MKDSQQICRQIMLIGRYITFGHDGLVTAVFQRMQERRHEQFSLTTQACVVYFHQNTGR